MSTRVKQGVLVSSLVLALVASACGRSSKSSTTATTSGSSATTAATASGDFGTLKGVCGPGNAKGATDPGVTDTTINVATMSDPGATAQPGLNQELFDSADAFVGWCNAAGGIQGRKLTLHKRDAALFQAAARMVEACQAPDFMLVGNGEALDATGVQQRLSCKLPEISGFDVSAQAGQAPLSLQSIPTADNESDLGGAYRALAKADPEAIKHYGVINSTYQSIKDSGNRAKAAAQALGYSVVSYQEVPLQVDNWRPIVQNLQQNGVQVMTFEGNPEQTAAIYRTMSDIGYFPKYTVLSVNHYDPKLTTQGGAAINGSQGGLFVNTFMVPFESADQNPPTKQYIGLLQQYAKGAKPKALGVNGFSAWLLFAESAKACGSNLTRSCVMDHAAATHEWTGGGLHAPTQPGNATTSMSQCFVLMKASNSGFTLDKDVLKPNNGVFNCDPANPLKLQGFPQG
jgi:ABC-type branched-subunit amino acid transport system substrate-binding protein